MEIICYISFRRINAYDRKWSFHRFKHSEARARVPEQTNKRHRTHNHAPMSSASFNKFSAGIGHLSLVIRLHWPGYGRKWKGQAEKTLSWCVIPWQRMPQLRASVMRLSHKEALYQVSLTVLPITFLYLFDLIYNGLIKMFLLILMPT